MSQLEIELNQEWVEMTKIKHSQATNSKSQLKVKLNS